METPLTRGWWIDNHIDRKWYYQHRPGFGLTEHERERHGQAAVHRKVSHAGEVEALFGHRLCLG